MYVTFTKHEIYIERRNGPIIWKPLFEDGDEGLVIVFLVFWIAVNRKTSHEDEEACREKHDGKKQNQY